MTKIKIGICGTAGRDRNFHFTRNTYNLMVRDAIQQIEIVKRILVPPQGQIEIKPEIHLVSGGAALSDHCAISIYLMNRCDRLILHFPAKWDHSKPCFEETSAGKTANYYHRQFSQKISEGESWKNYYLSLQGIQRAINKGAEYYTYTSFKERNLEIAKSDALIAYTHLGRQTQEGEVLIPRTPGTLHTWRNCKSKLKIVRNINDLIFQ